MFKAFKFYLYQLFTLSLLFNFSQANNQIPNREIIILLEKTDAESINLTLQGPPVYDFDKILQPTGINAMTITLLIAMHQKAAPIIVNKALIKNLVDHQNLFSNFVNLDRNTLHNLYGHYNRFKGHLVLDNFITNCKYIGKSTPQINKIIEQLIKSTDLKNENLINQKLKKLVTDPHFNVEFCPKNIQQAIKDPNKIQALGLEMSIYTMCNWIDFKKDWQIKKVNEDIFLLIPKTYIKNLNLEIPRARKTPQFTNLEIALGLKIDHMPNIERSFFEQPSYPYNEIPFVESLKQIFITHTDIKKFKLDKSQMQTWSTYIAGHGLSKCPQLGILPQLRNLKKIFENKLKSSDSLARKYQHKIKKLDNEIKNLQKFTHSPNKKDHGLIASLSIPEFRNVLKFFNDEINVILLYYTSCYAGGVHLIEPYTEIDNKGITKPLTFKYPIICGSIAENSAIQEIPGIYLPPYADSNYPDLIIEMTSNDIDFSAKKLKLHTTLQYNNFFESLRKGIHLDKEKLLLLVFSLHPHIDKSGKIRNDLISNIPLIRFAHSDHFELIPNDNSSIILDSNNSSKPNIIDKNSILLYDDYVPGKLTLNKLGKNQDLPHLISMLPDFALHAFEEINSSTLNLNEIVNSFLTFPELSSSKIFWIKKLECKSNQNQPKEIFNDVVIMRNVFNSITLAQCNGNERVRFENCAYFSKSDNNTAKLTWDGPMIKENNFKINPWKNTEHKEDCLSSFPKLANFINPVLQSI